MIAIVGIRYRNYTHYTLYRSCLPIYGIAIVISLSFLFLDNFEGNTAISVAIRSSSTVSASFAFLMKSCGPSVTHHTTITGSQSIHNDGNSHLPSPIAV